MYYCYDFLGRYSHTSETEQPNSTQTEPAELTPEYNWNGYSWVKVEVLTSAGSQ